LLIISPILLKIEYWALYCLGESSDPETLSSLYNDDREQNREFHASVGREVDKKWKYFLHEMQTDAKKKNEK
jgi:hypothetical protein